MISVVIPCFNAASTLRETVESALGQNEELEVVVIDDGSTDDSPAIISAFGDRIVAIRTPNRGVSAARNLGTSVAKGTYIQYLDSDDVLATGTLALRRAAIEASGADVAHTDWQKLVEEFPGVWRQADITRPDVANLERDAEVATATSSFWAPPAALLYRRSIVDRVGEWSARLPVIQDARFLFDAAACGARFVHVPGVGAYYRVRSGSLSRQNHARFVGDCAVNASEIAALWQGRGPLTASQRQALAEIWHHVAMASLNGNFPTFDAGRDGYNTVAARKITLEFGAAMRTLLGGSGAAAILSRARRWRAAARRLSPDGMSQPKL